MDKTVNVNGEGVAWKELFLKIEGLDDGYQREICAIVQTVVSSQSHIVASKTRKFAEHAVTQILKKAQ